MKGYINIYEVNTFVNKDNKILSRVSFDIIYDDQIISSEITVSAFKSSQIDIYEGICKYFKGELRFK